jgi:peptidoglycan-associated lipoprotein
LIKVIMGFAQNKEKVMKKYFSGRNWLILGLLLSVIFVGCAKEQPLPEIDDEAARLEEERLRREEEERLRRQREEEERRRREAEEEASARKEFEARMSVMIYFDFDKSDLKPEAREILSQKASLMRERPTVRIKVEGHCDEWGTEEYNLALGERRASSAKSYLVNAGISADRISTISYGKEKPLDSAHNREAWAMNRRGEFHIVSWE